MACEPNSVYGSQKKVEQVCHTACAYMASYVCFTIEYTWEIKDRGMKVMRILTSLAVAAPLPTINLPGI